MFGLVVRFDLKHGVADAFDDLALATLEKIQSEEPGTLFYGCHKIADEPNARIFYELYANREAFDAHEQTGHVIHFLTMREEYFAKSPRVEFFSSFDGKGDVFVR